MAAKKKIHVASSRTPVELTAEAVASILPDLSEAQRDRVLRCAKRLCTLHPPDACDVWIEEVGAEKVSICVVMMRRSEPPALPPWGTNPRTPNEIATSKRIEAQRAQHARGLPPAKKHGSGAVVLDLQARRKAAADRDESAGARAATKAPTSTGDESLELETTKPGPGNELGEPAGPKGAKR